MLTVPQPTRRSHGARMRQKQRQRAVSAPDRVKFDVNVRRSLLAPSLFSFLTSPFSVPRSFPNLPPPPSSLADSFFPVCIRVRMCTCLLSCHNPFSPLPRILHSVA